MKYKVLLIVSIIFFAILLGCKEKNSQSDEDDTPIDPMKEKGIGPVSELKLGPIDQTMVEKGKEIFELKCTACHKFEEKVVGPALQGITKRRTPEWIMNMILNPVEMTQKDKIGQDLLATHLTQMTQQNLTEFEAREILEYLRKMDEN